MPKYLLLHIVRFSRLSSIPRFFSSTSGILHCVPSHGLKKLVPKHNKKIVVTFSHILFDIELEKFWGFLLPELKTVCLKIFTHVRAGARAHTRRDLNSVTQESFFQQRSNVG